MFGTLKNIGRLFGRGGRQTSRSMRGVPGVNQTTFRSEKRKQIIRSRILAAMHARVEQENAAGPFRSS